LRAADNCGINIQQLVNEFLIESVLT